MGNPLDVYADGSAVDVKWGAVLQFPVIPVATALLPSGKARPLPFSVPFTSMCMPLCPGYADDTWNKSTCLGVFNAVFN